jgi:hypothetical protein
MRSLVFLLLALLCPARDPEMPSSALFAPGVVSTPAHEGPFALTPDGQAIYFTRFTAGTIYPGFFVSRLHDGRWTNPDSAPFPKGAMAAPFFISPDGRTLFFTHEPDSTRRMRLWIAESDGDGWTGARPLAGALETWSGDQFSPSVASDGTLYFTSNRRPGSGGWDIYRSLLKDGQYTEPELLGGGRFARVSTLQHERSVTVSADGTRLVFSSSSAPNGLGGSDLYIASLPRSDKDSMWVDNLGPLVNTAEDETDPRLAPDGKRLYFCRSGDIYSVDLDIVLRPPTESSMWKQRSQIPTPRQWPQLAVASGKVYVYGGIIGGLGSGTRTQWTNLVEVYDPTANSWDSLPSIPEGWLEGTLVSMDDRLFLFRRGGPGVAEYRADLKRWEIRPGSSFTISQAPPFRTRTVVLGRKAYTTYTSIGPWEHSYFVEYDFDTNVWAPKRAMPFPAPQIVALNGKIYSFSGGEDHICVYDPAADTWQDAGRMDMPRWESAVVAFDRQIWLIGGHGLRSIDPIDGGITPTVMRFDPVRNVWARGPELPHQRAAVAAVAVNGRLLVFGGIWPSAAFSYDRAVLEYAPTK